MKKLLYLALIPLFFSACTKQPSIQPTPKTLQEKIQNISETSNKDLRLERAQVGLERIRAIVSLNQPPFNKIRTNTNVVSISGNKSDD